MLEKLKQETSSCTWCELHKGRINPVFSKGNVHSNILICGMCPGPDENKETNHNKFPFVGLAGQFLDEILADTSLTLEDVYITNIVKCFLKPGINLKPEWIEKCISYFIGEVDAIKPKVIVTLGKDAFIGLHGPCALSMTDIRKETYTFFDIPLIPSYHPSYLIRAGRKKHKDYSKVIEDFTKAITIAN